MALKDPDPDRRDLPLAPVLALSLALPLVPRPLAQGLLTAICDAACRRHRRLFDRLRPLGQATIAIDPVDLPALFVLSLDASQPRMHLAARNDPSVSARAVIRARLATLVALIEGRADADALFFRRLLAIEGDTEAVVALRNAIEAEPISAIDLATAPLAPLDGVAIRLGALTLDLCRRAEAGFSAAAEAIAAPIGRRLEEQECELQRLRDRVSALEGAGRRR